MKMSSMGGRAGRGGGRGVLLGAISLSFAPVRKCVPERAVPHNFHVFVGYFAQFVKELAVLSRRQV